MTDFRTYTPRERATFRAIACPVCERITFKPGFVPTEEFGEPQRFRLNPQGGFTCDNSRCAINGGDQGREQWWDGDPAVEELAAELLSSGGKPISTTASKPQERVGVESPQEPELQARCNAIFTAWVDRTYPA